MDLGEKIFGISFHGGVSYFLTMSFLKLVIGIHDNFVESKKFTNIEKSLIELEKSIEKWKNDTTLNFKEYNQIKNDLKYNFKGYLEKED